MVGEVTHFLVKEILIIFHLETTQLMLELGYILVFSFLSSPGFMELVEGKLSWKFNLRTNSIVR